MDWVTIILVLIILAMTTLYMFPNCKHYLKNIYYLEKLPGNVAFPLIGTSYTHFGVPLNRIFEHFQGQCRKFYPKIFRTYIGRMCIVHLHKAEHFEKIVSSQVHLSKGPTYKHVEPWLGFGLLTSSGKKWHTHRKMITPAFHFKILDVFQDIFFEKTDILLSKLESHADGQIFDIHPYITACALDIICETAMGVQVKAQENGDSDYLKALQEISELVVLRNFTGIYHFDIIWNNSSAGKRFKKCLVALHGFTDKVIQERKLMRNSQKRHSESKEENEVLGQKKRLAFLDILLDASLDGVKLTDLEIREETDTFMFEGHDTTTSAVCWSLFILGNYPDVQKKVQQELDDIFQGTDRPIEKQDLTEMKYLERVIKETMRLYPSVPTVGRTTEEDTMIDGYFIPKGTSLGIHIYPAHRDPDHFPNPLEFNPDNFLPDRVASRHPYAFMPFSAGPRNCIGQKFAMLEEKVIVSMIMRKYSIKSLETPEQCQKAGFLILRNLNGFKVTLVPRV